MKNIIKRVSLINLSVSQLLSFSATKAIALVVVISLLITTIGNNAYAVAQSFDNIQQEENVASIFSEGKITGFNDTGSTVTVVNIQDLHCHYQTQQNISSIIKEVEDNYGIKAICVEGGYGQIDTSWLSNIKDEKLRQNLTEKLLEEGELTGAEYYVIKNNKKNILKGLDEEKIHKENIKRLSSIIENEDKYTKTIERVKYVINKLNNKYVNRRNRKFTDIVNEYRQEKIDTTKYYGLLWKYIDKINEEPQKYNNIVKISKTDYPNISKYLQLTKNNKKVKTKQATIELQQVLTELKQILSYGEFSNMLADTKNLKNVDKLVSYIQYYNNEDKINLEKYTQLNSFIKLNYINNSLNPVEMIKEESLLEDQIRKSLSYNLTEYEIAYITSFEQYFEKYLNYALTCVEWKYTEAGMDKFRKLYTKYAVVDRIKEIEKDFDNINKYYQANETRNSIFVDNITKYITNNENANVKHKRTAEQILKDSKEVIVVVSGGYHSEELKDMLSDKDVNDIIITPNVLGDIDISGEKYKQIIKGQGKIQSQALAYTLASCATDKQQKELLIKTAVDIVGNENLSTLSDLFNENIEVITKEFKKRGKQVIIKAGNQEFELVNSVKEEEAKSKVKNIIYSVIENNKNVLSYEIKNFFAPDNNIVDNLILKTASVLSDMGFAFSDGMIFEIEKSQYNGRDILGISPEIYSNMSSEIQKAILESQEKTDKNKKYAVVNIDLSEDNQNYEVLGMYYIKGNNLDVQIRKKNQKDNSVFIHKDKINNFETDSSINTDGDYIYKEIRNMQDNENVSYVKVGQLSNDDIKSLGKEQKNVVIKNNILNKNLSHHKDISIEQFGSLLEALKNPEFILQNQPGKPNNYSFIKEVEDKADNSLSVALRSINNYNNQKSETYYLADKNKEKQVISILKKKGIFSEDIFDLSKRFINECENIIVMEMFENIIGEYGIDSTYIFNFLLQEENADYISKNRDDINLLDIINDHISYLSLFLNSEMSLDKFVDEIEQLTQDFSLRHVEYSSYNIVDYLEKFNDIDELNKLYFKYKEYLPFGDIKYFLDKEKNEENKNKAFENIENVCEKFHNVQVSLKFNEQQKYSENVKIFFDVCRKEEVNFSKFTNLSNIEVLEDKNFYDYSEDFRKGLLELRQKELLDFFFEDKSNVLVEMVGRDNVCLFNLMESSTITDLKDFFNRLDTDDKENLKSLFNALGGSVEKNTGLEYTMLDTYDNCFALKMFLNKNFAKDFKNHHFFKIFEGREQKILLYLVAIDFNHVLSNLNLNLDSIANNKEYLNFYINTFFNGIDENILNTIIINKDETRLGFRDDTERRFNFKIRAVFEKLGWNFLDKDKDGKEVVLQENTLDETAKLYKEKQISIIQDGHSNGVSFSFSNNDWLSYNTFFDVFEKNSIRSMILLSCKGARFIFNLYNKAFKKGLNPEYNAISFAEIAVDTFDSKDPLTYGLLKYLNYLEINDTEKYEKIRNNGFTVSNLIETKLFIPRTNISIVMPNEKINKEMVKYALKNRLLLSKRVHRINLDTLDNNINYGFIYPGVVENIIDTSLTVNPKFSLSVFVPLKNAKIGSILNKYAPLWENVYFLAPTILSGLWFGSLLVVPGIVLFAVSITTFLFSHTIVKWITDKDSADNRQNFVNFAKQDIRNLSIPTLLLTSSYIIPFAVVSIVFPIIPFVVPILTTIIQSLIAAIPATIFHYLWNNYLAGKFGKQKLSIFSNLWDRVKESDDPHKWYMFDEIEDKYNKKWFKQDRKADFISKNEDLLYTILESLFPRQKLKDYLEIFDEIEENKSEELIDDHRNQLIQKIKNKEITSPEDFRNYVNLFKNRDVFYEENKELISLLIYPLFKNGEVVKIDEAFSFLYENKKFLEKNYNLVKVILKYENEELSLAEKFSLIKGLTNNKILILFNDIENSESRKKLVKKLSSLSYFFKFFGNQSNGTVIPDYDSNNKYYYNSKDLILENDISLIIKREVLAKLYDNRNLFTEEEQKQIFKDTDVVKNILEINDFDKLNTVVKQMLLDGSIKSQVNLKEYVIDFKIGYIGDEQNPDIVRNVEIAKQRNINELNETEVLFDNFLKDNNYKNYKDYNDIFISLTGFTLNQIIENNKKDVVINGRKYEKGDILEIYRDDVVYAIAKTARDNNISFQDIADKSVITKDYNFKCPLFDGPCLVPYSEILNSGYIIGDCTGALADGANNIEFRNNRIYIKNHLLVGYYKDGSLIQKYGCHYDNEDFHVFSLEDIGGFRPWKTEDESGYWGEYKNIAFEGKYFFESIKLILQFAKNKNVYIETITSNSDYLKELAGIISSKVGSKKYTSLLNQYSGIQSLRKINTNKLNKIENLVNNDNRKANVVKILDATHKYMGRGVRGYGSGPAYSKYLQERELAAEGTFKVKVIEDEIVIKTEGEIYDNFIEKFIDIIENIPIYRLNDNQKGFALPVGENKLLKIHIDESTKVSIENKYELQKNNDIEKINNDIEKVDDDVKNKIIQQLENYFYKDINKKRFGLKNPYIKEVLGISKGEVYFVLEDDNSEQIYMKSGININTGKPKIAVNLTDGIIYKEQEINEQNEDRMENNQVSFSRYLMNRKNAEEQDKDKMIKELIPFSKYLNEQLKQNLESLEDITIRLETVKKSINLDKTIVKAFRQYGISRKQLVSIVSREETDQNYQSAKKMLEAIESLGIYSVPVINTIYSDEKYKLSDFYDKYLYGKSFAENMRKRKNKFLLCLLYDHVLYTNEKRYELIEKNKIFLDYLLFGKDYVAENYEKGRYLADNLENIYNFFEKYPQNVTVLAEIPFEEIMVLGNFLGEYALDKSNDSEDLKKEKQKNKRALTMLFSELKDKQIYSIATQNDCFILKTFLNDTFNNIINERNEKLNKPFNLVSPLDKYYLAEAFNSFIHSKNIDLSDQTIENLFKDDKTINLIAEAFFGIMNISKNRIFMMNEMELYYLISERGGFTNRGRELVIDKAGIKTSVKQSYDDPFDWLKQITMLENNNNLKYFPFVGHGSILGLSVAGEDGIKRIATPSSVISALKNNYKIKDISNALNGQFLNNLQSKKESLPMAIREKVENENNIDNILSVFAKCLQNGSLSEEVVINIIDDSLKYDITTTFIEAQNNGIPLNSIVLDFGCCESAYFAQDVYNDLIRKGAKTLPTIVTASSIGNSLSHTVFEQIDGKEYQINTFDTELIKVLDESDITFQDIFFARENSTVYFELNKEEESIINNLKNTLKQVVESIDFDIKENNISFMSLSIFEPLQDTRIGFVLNKYAHVWENIYFVAPTILSGLLFGSLLTISGITFFAGFVMAFLFSHTIVRWLTDKDSAGNKQSFISFAKQDIRNLSIPILLLTGSYIIPFAAVSIALSFIQLTLISITLPVTPFLVPVLSIIMPLVISTVTATDFHKHWNTNGNLVTNIINTANNIKNKIPLINKKISNMEYRTLSAFNDKLYNTVEYNEITDRSILHGNRIRDSIIENYFDLIEEFSSLNIEDEADLEYLKERIETEFDKNIRDITIEDVAYYLVQDDHDFGIFIDIQQILNKNGSRLLVIPPFYVDEGRNISDYKTDLSIFMEDHITKIRTVKNNKYQLIELNKNNKDMLLQILQNSDIDAKFRLYALNYLITNVELNLEKTDLDKIENSVENIKRDFVKQMFSKSQNIKNNFDLKSYATGIFLLINKENIYSNESKKIFKLIIDNSMFLPYNDREAGKVANNNLRFVFNLEDVSDTYCENSLDKDIMLCMNIAHELGHRIYKIHGETHITNIFNEVYADINFNILVQEYEKKGGKDSFNLKDYLENKNKDEKYLDPIVNSINDKFSKNVDWDLFSDVIKYYFDKEYNSISSNDANTITDEIIKIYKDKYNSKKSINKKSKKVKLSTILLLTLSLFLNFNESDMEKSSELFNDNEDNENEFDFMGITYYRPTIYGKPYINLMRDEVRTYEDEANKRDYKKEYITKKFEKLKEFIENEENPKELENKGFNYAYIYYLYSNNEVKELQNYAEDNKNDLKFRLFAAMYLRILGEDISENKKNELKDIFRKTLNLEENATEDKKDELKNILKRISTKYIKQTEIRNDFDLQAYSAGIMLLEEDNFKNLIKGVDNNVVIKNMYKKISRSLFCIPYESFYSSLFGDNSVNASSSSSYLSYSSSGYGNDLKGAIIHELLHTFIEQLKLNKKTDAEFDNEIILSTEEFLANMAKLRYKTSDEILKGIFKTLYDEQPIDLNFSFPYFVEEHLFSKNLINLFKYTTEIIGIPFDGISDTINLSNAVIKSLFSGSLYEKDMSQLELRNKIFDIYLETKDEDFIEKFETIVNKLDFGWQSVLYNALNYLKQTDIKTYNNIIEKIKNSEVKVNWINTSYRYSKNIEERIKNGDDKTIVHHIILAGKQPNKDVMDIILTSLPQNQNALKNILSKGNLGKIKQGNPESLRTIISKIEGIDEQTKNILNTILSKKTYVNRNIVRPYISKLGYTDNISLQDMKAMLTLGMEQDIFEQIVLRNIYITDIKKRETYFVYNDEMLTNYFNYMLQMDPDYFTYESINGISVIDSVVRILNPFNSEHVKILNKIISIRNPNLSEEQIQNYIKNIYKRNDIIATINFSSFQRNKLTEVDEKQQAKIFNNEIKTIDSFFENEKNDIEIKSTTIGNLIFSDEIKNTDKKIILGNTPLINPIHKEFGLKNYEQYYREKFKDNVDMYGNEIVQNEIIISAPELLFTQIAKDIEDGTLEKIYFFLPDNLNSTDFEFTYEEMKILHDWLNGTNGDLKEIAKIILNNTVFVYGTGKFEDIISKYIPGFIEQSIHQKAKILKYIAEYLNINLLQETNLNDDKLLKQKAMEFANIDRQNDDYKTEWFTDTLNKIPTFFNNRRLISVIDRLNLNNPEQKNILKRIIKKQGNIDRVLFLTDMINLTDEKKQLFIDDEIEIPSRNYEPIKEFFNRRSTGKKENVIREEEIVDMFAGETEKNKKEENSNKKYVKKEDFINEVKFMTINEILFNKIEKDDSAFILGKTKMYLKEISNMLNLKTWEDYYTENLSDVVIDWTNKGKEYLVREDGVTAAPEILFFQIYNDLKSGKLKNIYFLLPRNIDVDLEDLGKTNFTFEELQILLDMKNSQDKEIKNMAEYILANITFVVGTESFINALGFLNLNINDLLPNEIEKLFEIIIEIKEEYDSEVNIETKAAILSETENYVNKAIYEDKNPLRISLGVAVREFFKVYDVKGFYKGHKGLEARLTALQLSFVSYFVPILIGMVGLLNPAVPLIIGLSAFVSSIFVSNIVIHTMVDFKEIKARKELDSVLNAAVNKYAGEEEIVIPIYVVSNGIGKFGKELKNTGLKTEKGESIFAVKTSGALVLGVRSGASSFELANVLNGSKVLENLIKDKIGKEVDIKLDIVVENKEYVERNREKFEDSNIIFEEGMMVVEEISSKNSKEIIKEFKELSALKQTIGFTLADKMIISLESIKGKEELKQALNNGKTRKVITQSQYEELKGDIDLFELRENGIEVYIREGDRIREFDTREEIEVEKISENITMKELEEKLVTAKNSLVIDIEQLKRIFKDNRNSDVLDTYTMFETLIGNIKTTFGIGQLSEKDIKNMAYNIPFESLPNNINNIDLEKDISEIGVIYRNIKDIKVRKEYIEILKKRIIVKNKVKEERNIDLEQNKNNRNLEKILAKILSKQEELKTEEEGINIEEIKVEIENKTIKENKDEYERILINNNISNILNKNISEMTIKEKKIIVVLEILIPVIMDDKAPEVIGRNKNNDMAKDYRAMLAAA